MKKLLIEIGLALVLLTLAACSNTVPLQGTKNEIVEDNAQSQETTTKPEELEEITVADVLENQTTTVKPKDLGGESETTVNTYTVDHEKDVTTYIVPDMKDEQVVESPQPSTDSDYEKKDKIMLKVMDCVSQEVHELDAYAKYISEKSGDKAHFTMMVYPELGDVYRGGEETEYLGKYYTVYVGEQWEDHRVNWDWFFVSEDFNEVLWYYLLEGEAYTLSEWRNSSHYRTLSDAVVSEP